MVGSFSSDSFSSDSFTTEPTNEPAAYSLKNLKKYFDDIIYDNLGILTVSEIRRIQLTIVFWDISGFSKLCDELRDNQEYMVAFLKNYFDEATRVIKLYDGVLDKFIGDGILAYFGYSGENTNGSQSTDIENLAPVSAIKAALELRQKFQELKKRSEALWLKKFGKEIKIDLKCGVHTGMVYFGIIQTERRNQITILGRKVNFSQRLEHLAKGSEILISKEVRNILNSTEDFYGFNEINVEERIKNAVSEEKYKIKGFEDVDTVYSLTKRTSVNT